MDRKKLEDALSVYGPDTRRDTPFNTIYAAAEAHLQTLPRMRTVEAKLWVRFDERGKVIAAGPLGGWCGSTFEFHASQPKQLSPADAVFTGTAEIPE